MKFEEFKENIRCSYGQNLCLHINNSYLIESKKDIKVMLTYIHNSRKYKRLQARGYTRTFESEYREWRAHNVLYKLGFKRDRTGSVDIDNNEPKWRRFVYAILSIF